MAVGLLAFVPSVRADPGGQGGNVPGEAPGNSGNAPGHDPNGPGNSGNAPGHDPNGPGNSENAPGHQSDQGASIEQEAGASASADQQDVGNTTVTVRVDEPGNGTPVGQENRAEAQADATASATADTAGEATVEQDVHADSSATQSDVGNTAVSVRVGSPGDDGAVSQTNVAAAGATAAGDDPAARTAADASSTQSDVGNTSVSVRVFSPGDDGPITQENEAAATADAAGPAGEAGATATQDGVRNTSVSIRVESPGTPASVSQGNATTADADGGSAVVVTNDARDTALAVVVDGEDLERPGLGGLEIWEWDWTWQRDESESLAALFGTQEGTWTWAWDGSGHGTVTTRAADAGDAGLVAGSWQWSWQWDRAGISGWTWQWSWNESLACTTCIWIWNWSWSWTGQPAESAANAAGPAGTPPEQVNMARAEAEATVVAHAGQTASQGGAGNGAQYAGQLIEISQTAAADASAVQSGVDSVSRGDSRQVNVVGSEAEAILGAGVVQDVDQLVHASDAGVADQWSGQQADVAQTGRAAATVSQRDAALSGRGEHSASGTARANGSADVDQHATQAALVDSGSVSQSVAQLTIVEQSSDAVATVGQGGTTRSKVRGGAAKASAVAGGLALVDQAAEQTAARTGGTGIQDSAQLSYVAQDATARATAAQLAGAAALPVASSGAEALNRAWLTQAATQASFGSGLDLQEILQQSLVVQSATAVSTSNGGVAGIASVVNCAVTHQGATQSVRAGRMAGSSADASTFCFPPATEAPSPASAPQPLSAEGTTFAADIPAAASAVPEEEPILYHGRSQAAPTAQASPAARRPAPAVQHHELPSSGTPVTKLSAPHSTQARLDTRPGSTAGAGDAGTEPPLPPAGDPPMWVSAVAATASGAGPSGIAAILLAFALAAPVLLRAPEGSVVRRPTGVLARIDVPV